MARERSAIWATLNAHLYADISEADSFVAKKPLLAHYTTVATFEKIAEGKEIWFSNPLYMNDIEEVRWSINEGTVTYQESDVILAALGSEENTNYFVSCLNDCYRVFNDNQAFDTYVFCLSEHLEEDEDGLLSMWRGYGDAGKGLAIVFDGRAMAEVPESPLVIAQVTYKETEARRAWFAEQAATFAAAVSGEGITGEEVRYAAEALFGRLRMFSLFTKHAGFGEEREWRIVYFPERDHGGLMRSFRGYFVGPRGVEPKLKMKIAPMTGVTDSTISLASLVHTVLLGPSLQAPLPVQSMKRMLELMGHANLAAKVKASRIPFRPTGMQF